ncbi:hypothetical protein EQG49_06380 [Periweissella cryptocerci]|uniref:FAD/NAD(P)-binding domain-containing protein n=1 Tax=Periweissella cryptocerci TaxID=2506420 RepID=A0A4P6YTL8_9LACO|nr:FAD-dependent oxidoreductase [Periweissella cryptocerci]QBO36109.1 hypothetical protein EQG49_06380 [Periweissella cryptocerci]
MKTIIIGSSHAGLAAMRRILTRYPKMEITVFDRRSEHLSYIGAGAHMFLNDEISSPTETEYFFAEDYAALDVTAHLNTNVMKIDAANKTVHARNLVTGEQIVESYDKLIVGTGSYPKIPSISGIDSDRVSLLKSANDVLGLAEKMTGKKRVTILGGGMIGLETARVLIRQGFKVDIVQARGHLANSYVDADFAQKIQEYFEALGVRVYLNEVIERINENDDELEITTQDGETFLTEHVVVSVGVRPNSSLLNKIAQIGAKGEIIVDDYMYTSDENILAIGDAVGTFFTPVEQYGQINHAAAAISQGLLAGANVMGPLYKNPGSQATYTLNLGDRFLYRTGATEEEAIAANIPADSIRYATALLPPFMHDAGFVESKLIFNPQTTEILGLQLFSDSNLHDVVDMMSMGVNNKMKLSELAFGDLSFEPHFSLPYSWLSELALQALDKIEGYSQK